jgi:hypothetical protein
MGYNSHERKTARHNGRCRFLSLVATVVVVIWLVAIVVAVAVGAALGLSGHGPLGSSKSAGFEPTRANCQWYAGPNFAPADDVERDHFVACEEAGAFH